MSRAIDLIERLGALRRAERREAATRSGISVAQLDALEYLAGCNRYSDTPAAVADYLEATRGTTSQTLLALERKGLVSRRRDDTDRRVNHLAPTPAGLDLLEAVGGEIRPAAAALGAAEGAALERSLERMLQHVQRRRGRRSFGECGTCRHLRGAPGAFVCGLTREPLLDVETRLTCVEHEPGGGGRVVGSGDGPPERRAVSR